MSEIYSTLPESAQEKIDAVIGSIKNAIEIDGKKDIEILMAILEKSNELKKNIKAEVKSAIEKEKAETVEIAAKRGKAYIETLNDGDLFTFKYGRDGSKQATLPIVKKTEKRIKVEYTKDMMEPGTTTTARYIAYEKVVVPEDFVVGE